MSTTRDPKHAYEVTDFVADEPQRACGCGCGCDCNGDPLTDFNKQNDSHNYVQMTSH